VSQVYYAVPDPNPIACGGAQRLREAGIPAEKLTSVWSYDGTPLAAATVLDAVRKQNLRPAAVAAE
jgi:pyrimidine deaminase RibD-like protein